MKILFANSLAVLAVVLVFVCIGLYWYGSRKIKKEEIIQRSQTEIYLEELGIPIQKVYVELAKKIYSDEGLVLLLHKGDRFRREDVQRCHWAGLPVFGKSLPDCFEFYERTLIVIKETTRNNEKVIDIFVKYWDTRFTSRTLTKTYPLNPDLDIYAHIETYLTHIVPAQKSLIIDGIDIASNWVLINTNIPTDLKKDLLLTGKGKYKGFSIITEKDQFTANVPAGSIAEAMTSGGLLGLLKAIDELSADGRGDQNEKLKAIIETSEAK